MVEAKETNPTVVGRCMIVLDGLRKLVELGIVVPLQRFHLKIKHNEQEQRISMATVEPCLS